MGYNINMTVKVFRKKGNVDIKDVKKLAKALKEREVTIGVHKEEGQALNPETQTPVIKYAQWNEFGTEHKAKHNYRFTRHGQEVFIPAGSDIGIPKRPFVRVKNSPELRNAIKLWHRKIKMGLYKNLKYSTGGRVANELLGEVGRLYLHQMWHRLQFSSRYYPQNKPLTEKLKGFNHPLIDTGTLFQSLRYKVRHR